MTTRVYLVGGAVRDLFLGRPVKDLDFAVEADSFEQMKDTLHLRYGLRVWQERPEFVTLRGTVVLPAGIFGLPEDRTGRRIDADFTLCRAERMYHDKRHPSEVTPAVLVVDLARRDFTCNAIAIDELGKMIDPFQGRDALFNMKLETVGHARDRFEEDPLRMLRAVRFMANLGLHESGGVGNALRTSELVEMLYTVSTERVREELSKVKDWYTLMRYIMVYFPAIGAALEHHHPRLWFKPTVEAR